MKPTHWIVVGLGALGIATFLGLDGPALVWKWRHRENFVGHSPQAVKKWIADPDTKALADKITAFSLERTGCFGACPVYIFRVQRDRKASYEGKEFVAQTGHYTGAHRGSFEQLAYFAAARLISIGDSDHAVAIDLPKAIVTVEMTDGTKRSYDFGDHEPNDVSVFCTALDGVRLAIEWTPEERANQMPTPTSAGHR